MKVIFISSIFELRSQIWGRSHQRLLRYQAFIILRSSSIGGRLSLEIVFILKHLFFWFGPLSLCFKFEEDLISGCWDIQLLIFWGLLPLEVVIRGHFKYFLFWFAPLSLCSFLRKIRSVVAEIFNFLNFEVFFHWRSVFVQRSSSLIQLFKQSLWSNELTYKFLSRSSH